MKINNLDVIPFNVTSTRYWNGSLSPETTSVQTVTKITTDEGAEGTISAVQPMGIKMACRLKSGACRTGDLPA